MSKTVKTTLIVATVLIVVGVVISGIAFGKVGFDIRRFSNTEAPINHVYTSKPTANIQTITVRGVSENYRIVQHSGTSIEVSYYEDAQTTYTIEEQGNTLLITEKVTPGFFIFNFDFSMINRETVISVPASFTGSIDFIISSGNVTIQGLSDCSGLKVSNSSGNINCVNVSVVNDLSISAISGNIVCSDVSASKNLSCTSRSGDIRCTRISAGEISLLATSGNIICDGVDATRDLLIETASGDIRCSDMHAQSASLKATSGNITARRLSVSGLICRARSGDIVIDILGVEKTYRISARSLSGTVRVPSGNTQAANSIDLETTSGNIRLSFDS